MYINILNGENEGRKKWKVKIKWVTSNIKNMTFPTKVHIPFPDNFLVVLRIHITYTSLFLPRIPTYLQFDVNLLMTMIEKNVKWNYSRDFGLDASYQHNIDIQWSANNLVTRLFASTLKIYDESLNRKTECVPRHTIVVCSILYSCKKASMTFDNVLSYGIFSKYL